MKLPTDAHAAYAARLFESADAQLRQLLQEAVERGASGTARYYRNQLAEVNKVLKTLEQVGIPAVAEAVGQGYVSGALVAERTLGINGNFAGVHTEAVSVLVDNATRPLGEAIRTVGRRTEDVFRRAALNDVAVGIIAGSTRKEVTKAFTQNLVHDGITGFVDKGGHRWSLGKYGAMVARTTTREAVSHGTANRLLENGHDLVTISSHSHTPDECTDYDGQTFSLTGETEGYDVLDTYPPFHPNCVHVLTPAAATFDQFEKAVAEDAATGKPQITDGPVDEIAQRVQQEIDSFQVPHGLQYSIDSLRKHPDGTLRTEAEMNEPWGNDIHGNKTESRQNRIDKLIAEARGQDIEYLTRVGQAIEREVQPLIEVRRAELAVHAAKLEDEAKALRNRDFDLEDRELELNKLIGAEHVQEKLQEHIAEKMALVKERDKVRKAAAEAQAKARQARSSIRNADGVVRLDLLTRVRRNYGTGEIQVARKSKVSQMVQDQAKFLPREWVDEVNVVGKIGTKADKGRAYYSSSERTIYVGEGDVSTALHEYGHAVEAAMLRLRQAERAFYKHRTGNEPSRPLSEIYPGHGYRSDELAREDRFTNAYFGKDYRGSFYELLTMGLEGVFYGRHGLVPGSAADIQRLRDALKLEHISGSERAAYEKSLKQAEGDSDFVHWMLGILATL